MSEVSKFELLEAVEGARPHGSDKPSASPVYELAGGRSIEDNLAGVTSLAGLFMRSVKQYPDNDCLGTRNAAGEYEFLTYSQVASRVDVLGSALASVGLKKGESVGILGANCQEWMVAMQAANRMSYITVPLYDTLGENAVQFIIEHSSTQVVFAEGKKMPELAKVVDKVGKLLKHIIYWGEAPQDALDLASSGSVNVVKYEDFYAAGEANLVDGVASDPEDLCTIMYTSGTTGDPKGVMIKNKNVLAEISALQRYLVHTGYKQDQHDVYLSYLPLAHIFDRVAEEFYLSIGAKIGFWRGNAKLLTEDIVALRPTMFVGVPRIFERIVQGIEAKMNKAGCLTNMLFNYAMRHKKYYMDRGLSQDKASPLFDALVFSKIKAALGGHVKIIISGGAPLSLHLEDFLKVAMCAAVVQGYGLTETLAAASVSLPNGSGGNVGPPLPGVQMRLESCPELGYDALDYPPRGEVLVRADLVTSGYYKLESKTKEVLEPDGWFHTGDIGEILADGSFKIIDRKVHSMLSLCFPL